MALIKVESCQLLTAMSDLALRGWQYSDVGGACTVDASNGRRGNKCIKFGSPSGFLKYGITPAAATILGVASKANSGTPTSGAFLYVYAGPSTQCTIVMTAGGALSCYRGSSSFLLGTSPVVWSAGTYDYWEFKIKVDPSNGYFIIRKNGSVVYSLTGVNNAQSGAAAQDTIQFSPFSTPNASFPEYWCDVYLADDTGPAPHNDFLGDVRIDAFLPTGNGATNNFGTLVGAGSHYQAVNEATRDGDTSYVASSNATDQELFAFTGITHTPTTIYGAQGVAMSRKEDAGARALKPLCRSGGSTYYGTTGYPGMSYGSMLDIRVQDPNTSAAWTKTNLNTAQWGVEVG